MSGVSRIVFVVTFEPEVALGNDYFLYLAALLEAGNLALCVNHSLNQCGARLVRIFGDNDFTDFGSSYELGREAVYKDKVVFGVEGWVHAGPSHTDYAIKVLVREVNRCCQLNHKTHMDVKVACERPKRLDIRPQLLKVH